MEYFYFSDDGDLMALRYDNWKVIFLEQRVPGTLQIWQEPLVSLRVPKLFNLRTDPYERADITSNTYWDWMINHVCLFIPRRRSWRISCKRSWSIHRARKQQLYYRPGDGEASAAGR